MWHHLPMTGQLNTQASPDFLDRGDGCVARLGLARAPGDFMTGDAIRGSPVPPFWLVPLRYLRRGRPRRDGAEAAEASCLDLAASSACARSSPWPSSSVGRGCRISSSSSRGRPRWRPRRLKALSWVVLQTLGLHRRAGAGAEPRFVLGHRQVFRAAAVAPSSLRARCAGKRRLRANWSRPTRNCIPRTPSSPARARDAERLRISRELHDAWGHELTALGLQLEIASHVTEPAPGHDHVMKAKGLASDLLAKVRDVVGTLRDAERCDLKDALEALAQSIPVTGHPCGHLSRCPGQP